MAVGLAPERVQVSSYVPKTLKERAERLRRANHRNTLSWTLERCMEIGLPVLEKELKPQSK